MGGTEKGSPGIAFHTTLKYERKFASIALPEHSSEVLMMYKIMSYLLRVPCADCL